ncbi:MAG TPA: carboxypeptidase-like regulatory domain-containing protein, partial [Xanthobacteraceae bacterium]|nr:carboxypeptidase-like regulatory domain-containing protein [Xanthobacteraceae bacterium]
MARKSLYASVAAIALTAALAGIPAPASAQQPTSAIQVGAADIGGTVTGPNGPEAGVWVIAETTDLPTVFTKIVVTDDAGRYLIPDLPKAKYSVWVRGYGLVDSQKVSSEAGKTLNLTAVKAPSEAAAAEYYPGMYWYSMLRIPPASDFPGTGAKGNGIPEFIKSQHAWIDTVKNACQSCHAIGTKGVRSPSPKLGEFKDSKEMWTRRLQSGQAMENMSIVIARLGPDKGVSLYADWTDRVAKGELPFAKPERPQGIERNVVITEWGWATPTHYLHDEISTDKRKPTLNANGLIYGSPEESTDEVPVLDPVKNTATVIKHPYLDPKLASTKTNIMGPSVYWGEDPIWDGHTSIHNPLMDEQGRLWFTARVRGADNPDFCKKGSDHPSAKVAPQNQSARQLSMYDPKTQKWSLINTCFSTHHLYFGHDANNTLWTSAGGPQSGVVGWL